MAKINLAQLQRRRYFPGRAADTEHSDHDDSDNENSEEEDYVEEENIEATTTLETVVPIIKSLSNVKVGNKNETSKQKEDDQESSEGEYVTDDEYTSTEENPIKTELQENSIGLVKNLKSESEAESESESESEPGSDSESESESEDEVMPVFISKYV